MGKWSKLKAEGSRLKAESGKIKDQIKAKAQGGSRKGLEANGVKSRIRI